MSNSAELRRLAAWYRGQAERAGSPVIWDRRLRTAEELEAMASDLEKKCGVVASISRLDISEAWTKCWDGILRLPIEPLTNGFIHRKAELLVHDCRAFAGDDGVEWFLEQLGDSLLFVLEQLASDPDSVEWQRIHAALSGARAGLFGDMKIASVRG